MTDKLECLSAYWLHSLCSGLDVDGIYRVSGNLAVIQKLRHKADHGNAALTQFMFGNSHVISPWIQTVGWIVQTCGGSTKLFGCNRLI